MLLCWQLESFQMNSVLILDSFELLLHKFQTWPESIESKYFLFAWTAYVDALLMASDKMIYSTENNSLNVVLKYTFRKVLWSLKFTSLKTKWLYMHVERKSAQLLLENEHGFWIDGSKWRKLFFFWNELGIFYFVTVKHKKDCFTNCIGSSLFILQLQADVENSIKCFNKKINLIFLWFAVMS